MEIIEWNPSSLEVTEFQVSELKRHGELLNARTARESDDAQDLDDQSAFNIQKNPDNTYTKGEIIGDVQEWREINKAECRENLAILTRRRL